MACTGCSDRFEPPYLAACCSLGLAWLQRIDAVGPHHLVVLVLDDAVMPHELARPGEPAHVLRDSKPLRKQNGMPFTLPFSPDTIRWRRTAIVELRKLGIDL